MNANIGRTLWNLAMSLVESINDIFDFLLSPLTIGDITIFGYTFIEGFTFTPLMLGSGFFIILITITFLKVVSPL